MRIVKLMGGSIFRGKIKSRKRSRKSYGISSKNGDIFVKYVETFCQKFCPATLTNALSEIGDENFFGEIESFKLIKKLFKERMNNLAKDSELIVIIDELDRCRPDYAIQILEIVKHYFDMPCTFIIALDMEQLAHSVSTIYGANMDSLGYLRRFFDIVIQMNTPPTNLYIPFKCKYMGLECDGEDMELIETYSDALSLSLRDIDRILLNIMIMQTINKDSLKVSHLDYLMISLKLKAPLVLNTLTTVGMTDTVFNIEICKYFKNSSRLPYDAIFAKTLSMIILSGPKAIIYDSMRNYILWLGNNSQLEGIVATTYNDLITTRDSIGMSFEAKFDRVHAEMIEAFYNSSNAKNALITKDDFMKYRNTMTIGSYLESKYNSINID